MADRERREKQRPGRQLAEDEMKGRMWERQDVGEGARGIPSGGWLKRGMERQTAADEIHNLDPMRSLYLV